MSYRLEGRVSLAVKPAIKWKWLIGKKVAIHPQAHDWSHPHLDLGTSEAEKMRLCAVGMRNVPPRVCACYTQAAVLSGNFLHTLFSSADTTEVEAILSSRLSRF